jgi:RNA-splicing ligase RtcB
MNTKLFIVVLLALFLWVSDAKPNRIPKERSVKALPKNVELNKMMLRLLRTTTRFKFKNEPKTIEEFTAAETEILNQQQKIDSKRNLVYKILKTIGYRRTHIERGKSKRWKPVYKKVKGKKTLLGFKITVPLRRYRFAGYPVVIASITSKENDRYLTQGIVPIRYATHKKFEVFIPMNTETLFFYKIC